MPAFNQSCPNPSTFLLTGIPGLETQHIWIAIPICLMYMITLLGNGAVLFIVKQDETLHEPMYYFLCMLALIGMLFSTTVVPKMLSIFWLDSKVISYKSCFIQMFFVLFLVTVESGVLVAMAVDRYVAICNPLRTNVIPHSFCDHVAVVNLATSDTSVSDSYIVAVAPVIVVADYICIAFSYGMILRSVFRLSPHEVRFKALSTCGSHFCILLFFYLGGIFSMYLHVFDLRVPHHIHTLVSDLYFVFTPMLNPVIYGMKTKQIRKWIFKLFGQKWIFAESSV
ncbi:olfactory receptor 52E4-like [Carettochelys insculpta]|uniref:olfactory receptor 52E4-like n=1 Tax=Carettochelys insculpta TaxID=44489 RepID=UPI003EBF1FA7